MKGNKGRGAALVYLTVKMSIAGIMIIDEKFYVT